MLHTNKDIDVYIKKSAAFAKPILIHLRQLIHKTCPEVEERIKWGFPHFDYKGQMMCSMAAFKNHCALNFWKASLIQSIAEEQNVQMEKSMGKFGKITSIDDLPSDKKLKQILLEALLLNDNETKIIKNKPVIKEALEIPAYFTKGLKQNKQAYLEFEKFSTSNKKEYITWVEEAKTETTKKNRLEQSISWIAEGKPRNWKYMTKYKSANGK